MPPRSLFQFQRRDPKAPPVYFHLHYATDEEKIIGRQIGVKLDGKVFEGVIGYHARIGWIDTRVSYRDRDGVARFKLTRLYGKVEPFWIYGDRYHDD